ncbi:MAG: PAS domain-containing protein [Chloroflexales bacterium]|nr:PAS domain-containing protein [Chloroflexales bacterium]
MSDTSQSPPILRAALAISGGLARASAEWRRVLGWSPKDLAGGTFIERVHPDDLDAVVHAIHTAYASGAPVAFTCRYAHKDGSYPHMLWEATPRLERLELELTGKLAEAAP